MIAIVAASANHTNARIAGVWRSLGIDVQVIPVSRAYERLTPGDTALCRIDVRRSIDGVQSGMLELLALQRAGITLRNSAATLLRAHDKLRTARRLAAAGLPHPRTEHVTEACPLATVPAPAVIKPRFGSWGAGVQRCDSPADLSMAIDSLRSRRWFKAQGALVQTLVPPAGFDMRVLVAGGQVVGGVSRVAAPGEWRTNISLGGHRRPTVPSPRAAELALAAARAVDGDLVGVDLLPCDDDYVVIEINGAVDFDASYSLPGRDVYEDVADALGLLPSVEVQLEGAHHVPLARVFG